MGFPLLTEDSIFLSPKVVVEPGSEEAKADDKPFDSYMPPQDDFAGQDYNLKFEPDKDGMVRIAFVNPKLKDGLGFWYEYNDSSQYFK